MAVYQTTLPIAATAETVWAILVDFERWREWNPSVPSIKGDVEVGSTVRLTLAMPGRPTVNVKAQTDRGRARAPPLLARQRGW